MKNILFLIMAFIGTSTIVQAAEMTSEEAQERARIVTMGGDD